MTPPLGRLQSDVLDALFDRPSAAADHVVPAGLRPQQRLDIYRHNLEAGLTGALAAVYPTVAALVGEGFFRYAAHGYIHAHPSRSGNLHDFGGELASFLEGFEPARALPYLPDCARLDWAWHEAFHAVRVDAADAAAGLARLAALPEARRPQVRLAVQPAARVLASPWPILAIWQAHQGEMPPGDAALADLDAGGESVLVIQRGDGDVALHRLAPAEHALVHALQHGAPLGDAVAAALAADAAADIAGMLARQFAIGLWIGLDDGSP